jgi:HAD superfamily hydrolase (TIGR01509 family)
MAEEKNEIYKKLLSGMSPCDVKEETRDTLAALKAMGLLLAIGSSSRNAPYILNKTQLEGFFDAVSDGNNISRSKPDPEVFLKAAQMLGLLPAECLVIEDAHAGIEAGAAGGFDTAGIGDARNCEKRSFAIDEVADILKIVENARLPK